MGSHGIQRSRKGRSSPPGSQKEAEKGGQAPPRTQKGDQGPSGSQFSSLSEPTSHAFQYPSPPPFDYAEICSNQFRVARNDRRRRDQRTNEPTNEWANARANRRTNERAKEPSSEGSNKRTNEHTNERPNDRTNEHTTCESFSLQNHTDYIFKISEQNSE